MNFTADIVKIELMAIVPPGNPVFNVFALPELNGVT